MIDQADQRKPDPARPGAPAAQRARPSELHDPHEPHRASWQSAESPAGPLPRRRAAPWRVWPLLGLTCFFVLLWQVASHGPVTGLDIRVRDHVNAWAATPWLGWLAAFGRGVANLGNQAVAIPVLPAVALFAAWRSRSTLPLKLTVAAALVLATVIPLKIWVGRPGPGTVVLGDANFGYFPSGHTADAMLCYGTSALILCFTLPMSRIARRVTVWAAVILALFTVFGLLWSDYHWLSDILGSICYCGAALVLLHRFAVRTQTVPERDAPVPVATSVATGTGDDSAQD